LRSNVEVFWLPVFFCASFLMIHPYFYLFFEKTWSCSIPCLLPLLCATWVSCQERERERKRNSPCWCRRFHTSFFWLFYTHFDSRFIHHHIVYWHSSFLFPIFLMFVLLFISFWCLEPWTSALKRFFFIWGARKCAAHADLGLAWLVWLSCTWGVFFF
jgi:hypothetical protein